MSWRRNVTGVLLWTSLMLGAVGAARGADIEDTCLMTLVVPKEKMKHTCDVQEQFQKKLDQLEGQINFQAKVIKDLEMMLRKGKSPKKPTPARPPGVYQVDPGPQVLPDEEDLYISPTIPDLSDDYPDFADYYPPDVSSRIDSGGKPRPAVKPDRQDDKWKGLNVLGLDLLKPYIDRELARLKLNISQALHQKLHPFAAGFEEVKQFIRQNASHEANTVSTGAQTSMNTIALSHLFVQVSKVHDKLLHMNTQHISLHKRVGGMESRVMSIYQRANQRTTDLRTRLLQLEHENRLLKLNQTYQTELQGIRLDIARQISSAKDQMRVNCKSKRRTKVRARIAQDDYYYEDDGEDGENVIDDNWKPLTEIPAFQELEKNLTHLQAWLPQQLQRVEDAVVKTHAAWNVTDARLKEEVVERKLADNKANASLQSGLQLVNEDVWGLSGQVTEVREMVAQVREDIKANQKAAEQQLTALEQLLADLRKESAKNFTGHSELIKNTSWTIGHSIHKLQKSDEELTQMLDTAVGKSNQKLTENRLSILEWRERVTENNASLTHLSKELHSLSEQVTVSVLSLNDSMRTLGVQLQLNNETWLPYSFTHMKSHVKCFGEKYVKKTNYPSGSIVGVVLCSPDMYKIFLSDSLTDTFLDVADSDGYGHDHCEFVGGKLERTSQLGNTPVFYKRQMGYKRHSWGEAPKRTYLGLLNLSPEWYRCGISIST